MYWNGGEMQVYFLTNHFVQVDLQSFFVDEEKVVDVGDFRGHVDVEFARGIFDGDFVRKWLEGARAD